jgi:hypothetical protein
MAVEIAAWAMKEAPPRAAAYWCRFGIELPETPPVLVNLHTAAIGVRPEVSLAVRGAQSFLYSSIA